jgi:protein-tyrosine phosphatase
MEPAHTAKITSILKAGVYSFICLQEYWELRSLCRPYVHLAQKVGGTRELEFFHCPIPDQSITILERLEAAVATIMDLLLAGSCVYLHSWGGNGRTGTVACAFLVKAYGMTVEAAQTYFMATQRMRPAFNQLSPGCWPHSPEQFEQVKKLEHSGSELSCRRLARLSEWVKASEYEADVPLHSQQA